MEPAERRRTANLLIFFVRHSERIDQIDNQQGGQEVKFNAIDPVITENGKVLAQDVGKQTKEFLASYKSGKFQDIYP